MKNLKKDNKGFSLVELLVVIAIMVVLVGVVAPSLLNNIEKSREAKDVQALDTVAGAIQACMTDEEIYDLLTSAKDVGTGIEVAAIYNGTAASFNPASGTADATVVTKFKETMISYLAADNVMDGTNLKLTNLLAGKVGKNTSNKLYFKLNTSTGKITVYVSTAADAAAVKGSAKTEYSVTR